MADLRSIMIIAVAAHAFVGASAATATTTTGATARIPDILVARVNAVGPGGSFAIYSPATARLSPVRGAVLNATELAVSPQGNVAYTLQATTGYGGSTLYVTSNVSRAGVVIAHSDVATMSPDWSPDGRRVAFVKTTAPSTVSRLVIETFSSRSRVVQRHVFSASGSYSRPRWSADGRTLAVVEANTNSSRLVVVDVATGQRRTLLTVSPPAPATPAPISTPSWYERNVVVGLSDGIYELPISGRGGRQLLNPAHDSINPLVAAGVVALGSKTGEGAYSFEIVRGSTTKTLAGFVPTQWLDQLPAGASGR
jgi:hypothetical protein